MPNQFQIDIPCVMGDQIDFNLGLGDVLYLLGANGTGKSSLVTRLFAKYQNDAKRISAHRQNWFQSDTLDITPHSRQNLEENRRNQDAQPQSRYREWNAAGRAGMALFDLIDTDAMQARKISGLVRAEDMKAAEEEAKNPSAIQTINELMRLSNLPITINVVEGQRVEASKSGRDGYNIAQLSDGERNAFLIAAETLTAKPGTLILIDEPERHLHRSIISPLLRLLFDRRRDCTFIVSTHEIMLPLESPKASTLLVRSCEFDGESVRAWTADLLAPGAVIDDELKSDILGSRRKMVFVEGASQSLDTPLYSLLFPEVSVIPKEGCRDVEHAVRGLRGAKDIHWVSAWGIIDNDQRSAKNIARLKVAGVWALSHYSVESLYFHPKIVAHVAERLVGVLGGDAKRLSENAITSAIAAVKAQRDHLIAIAVQRSVRSKVLEGLPSRNDLETATVLNVDVDVAALRMAETKRIDALISAADWDGLLTRYPLRESSAFDQLVAGLKIKDRSTYHSAVLKLLQDDAVALSELRNLLGDLYANVTAGE